MNRTRLAIYPADDADDADGDAARRVCQRTLPADAEPIVLGLLRDVALKHLGFDIWVWVDARELGLMEMASASVGRLARAAAAQRAKALYPDAAAATALGLDPDVLGARYLVGRALPWTAPDAPPQGETRPLPDAVARLGPVAFAPYLTVTGVEEQRQIRELLPPAAEDDTIFFVTVLRRRVGEREATPLVQQAIPASLLPQTNSGSYSIRKAGMISVVRSPTFEVLRQSTPHLEGVTTEVPDPWRYDYEDPGDEAIMAYEQFQKLQWEAHRASVEKLVSQDYFSITVHAASISDGRFVCVLDEELNMEPEHTESLEDDGGVAPTYGSGTVGLLNGKGSFNPSPLRCTKNLLQGTGDHFLKVRSGVGIKVVKDEPVGSGDFVRSTLRIDKLSLALTPYQKGAQMVKVFGHYHQSAAYSFTTSHRQSQSLAILRALDDAWFPVKPAEEKKLVPARKKKQDAATCASS